MLDAEQLLREGRKPLTPQDQQSQIDILRLWRIFRAMGPLFGSAETPSELNVYAFRAWRQDHLPRVLSLHERDFLAEYERQEEEDRA